VKTPTRLVEEIHANNNNNNNSMKTIEPDTNVFDILSSSTTTDPMSNTDPTENSQHSCTYNVVISSRPNKVGLTIKKVVQP
jgi:chromatin remodeling complex protein RSC6